ncbi:hypothetical protein TNCV_1972881 [Trichonephila clavipes]|nr:hypothetical protein TNCV_1972881 [Trichonephila clavipes]
MCKTYNAKEERNWSSKDTTNVDTKRVFGLKWIPIMISRAVAELGQRFRLKMLYGSTFPAQQKFSTKLKKQSHVLKSRAYS